MRAGSAHLGGYHRPAWRRHRYDEPTLLAIVGDVAHPSWRARTVGVYQLWRHGGFAPLPVTRSARHAGAPRIQVLAAGYPKLIAVLAAAVLGLSLQPPLAWAADHQGINILLASPVFATALTIEPAALGRLAATWPSLPAALGAGITVLAALSWAAAKSPRPGRCAMAS